MRPKTATCGKHAMSFLFPFSDPARIEIGSEYDKEDKYVEVLEWIGYHELYIEGAKRRKSMITAIRPDLRPRGRNGSWICTGHVRPFKRSQSRVFFFFFLVLLSDNKWNWKIVQAERFQSVDLKHWVYKFQSASSLPSPLIPPRSSPSPLPLSLFTFHLLTVDYYLPIFPFQAI